MCSWFASLRSSADRAHSSSPRGSSRFSPAVACLFRKKRKREEMRWTRPGLMMPLPTHLDRRSALVAEESSERIVQSPLKYPLISLMCSEEVFHYGTCPLICLACLGQSGGHFRAMHFNCYTLPIPLLISSLAFVGTLFLAALLPCRS